MLARPGEQYPVSSTPRIHTQECLCENTVLEVMAVTTSELSL
jgi:hypothetical protein